MKTYIKIHKDDNVAVALTDLEQGFVLKDGESQIPLQEVIVRGHKVALKSMAVGESVVKYGAVIGVATAPISPGYSVHTHNIKTALGAVLDYTYCPTNPSLEKKDTPCFQGYRRKNGKVGVRNDIFIIPTVGCVNNIVQAIARESKNLVSGGTGEVIAFTHPYGCSQMGDDQENTKKILANLVNHPNAGGVLVVGLGCENSNVEQLKQYIGVYDATRVKFIVCQDCDDEIQAGVGCVADINVKTSLDTRQPIGAERLVVGLKCGGSDGLSGITANPALGLFSDKLVSVGGSTILTEVPEMFGAETLLMARCQTQAVFDKTVALINDFKAYFNAHNQVIYENPSPGNKQGGISTLEDKSLGCTQKSGSAPIVDVLNYGDSVTCQGLQLLSAPGNDLVASTALAAAGAHIVLFTTGRGTPFSCPVPTVKISSNTALHVKKSNWIDFDCGRMLLEDGQSVAENLFQYVLAVASGEKTKAEEAGYHDLAIFKTGVTL